VLTPATVSFYASHAVTVSDFGFPAWIDLLLICRTLFLGISLFLVLFSNPIALKESIESRIHFPYDKSTW